MGVGPVLAVQGAIRVSPAGFTRLIAAPSSVSSLLNVSVVLRGWSKSSFE